LPRRLFGGDSETVDIAIRCQRQLQVRPSAISQQQRVGFGQWSETNFNSAGLSGRASGSQHQRPGGRQHLLGRAVDSDPGRSPSPSASVTEVRQVALSFEALTIRRTSAPQPAPAAADAARLGAAVQNPE
jgi:hypothetical protein